MNVHDKLHSLAFSIVYSKNIVEQRVCDKKIINGWISIYNLFLDFL